MKVVGSLAVALALTTTPALAQKKSCEELKSEIAAKLDAKGVKNYTLNVVVRRRLRTLRLLGVVREEQKELPTRGNRPSGGFEIARFLQLRFENPRS
jgi:hypothetical protein